MSDDPCLAVCESQHGCISRGQALICGLSGDAIGRRCRSGRWIRVLPRVYAVRGSPATWERRFAAAVLWAGDGAVLSMGSAAWLWRFPDWKPGIPELTHPGNKRSRKDVRVHRAEVVREDVTWLDGFPLTTPARTLVDMAGRLGRRSFDIAFHYCLHARLTTLGDVERAAARRWGHPGAAVVRAALDAYGGGPAPASALETRVARLLRGSRLPRPRRQHEVVTEHGRRHLDFAWPKQRVALEVDGYRWDSSRSAWESDRARTKELRRAGWTIVVATHDDVTTDGAALIDELAGLLAQ